MFANNDCTTSGGGYAGLELEDAVTNIEVYGNNFHGLAGPHIAHVHTKETNVNIHDTKRVEYSVYTLSNWIVRKKVLRVHNMEFWKNLEKRYN